VENIERYIRELKAIKNYDKVIRERDELSWKVAALGTRLKSTSQELAVYKELKVRFVDGGQTSLDEARQDFLMAMDAEIERRSGERFEELKREYEGEMPQLVYQRLVDIVKGRLWPQEIAAVVSTEAEKKVKWILYHSDNWPDRFKEYYRKEVEAGIKSGLDSEFGRRVEESAEVKARQRLGELVNTAWPAWFNKNVHPRISELEGRANENALQLLKGPWTLTCDRCGTKSSTELTAFGVEELLRKGKVQVECDNPACQDRFFLSTSRHRFGVSLYDLVEAYIGRE